MKLGQIKTLTAVLLLGISSLALAENGSIRLPNGIYGPKGNGLIAIGCKNQQTGARSFEIQREFEAKDGQYGFTGRLHLVVFAPDFSISQVIPLVQDISGDKTRRWVVVCGQNVRVVSGITGWSAAMLEVQIGSEFVKEQGCYYQIDSRLLPNPS
jgi:hypothetical protein